jgi:hypothetical protein
VIFVLGFLRSLCVCVSPAQTEEGNCTSNIARMGFKLSFMRAVFFLCVFGGKVLLVLRNSLRSTRREVKIFSSYIT